MTTVGLFEAKNRLSELVKRAARGEEIVITRHGVSVARLLPAEVPDAHAQGRALAERIRCTRGLPIRRGGVAGRDDRGGPALKRRAAAAE